jgi:hypothetical protein
MKIERKAGILVLGSLEELNEDPGVKFRTSDGDEICLLLTKEEVQEIGISGLLFKNVTLTISVVEDPS